jgi:hypothetical protein
MDLNVEEKSTLRSISNFLNKIEPYYINSLVIVGMISNILAFLLFIRKKKK